MNKNIDHVFIPIDYAPETLSYATDRDENPNHESRIAQMNLSTTKLYSIFRPEPETLLPELLIGNNNAAFSQQVFDIAKAYNELILQPIVAANDLGRNLVAVRQRG